MPLSPIHILFQAYHDNQPFNDNMLRPCPMLENPDTVSYTHLDVYKRQVISMAVNALYNIVDSYFVAKISEDAMTALALVFPMQNNCPQCYTCLLYTSRCV